MTDEQQAQRALTGKVEVFVGDKHIIANGAFGAISVKIRRITEHAIHYDWDTNLKTRWVWTHKNEIVSHAEFTRNLRDYLKSKEAVERESLVLDLRVGVMYDRNRTGGGDLGGEDGNLRGRGV